MSIRGHQPWLDDEGEEIYAEFTVDSHETVRLTLKKRVGTTLTPLDLSSSSLKVYFRSSIVGSATVPVDTELTNVTDGTDGVVSGEVVHRSADFTGAIGEGAALSIEKAAVVVNESVVDALTESGFKETQWYSRAPVFLRGAMNAT